MRHQCILDTSGYELVFYLQSLDATKKCVGILVEFRLKPSHGNFSIRSGATTTYIAELEKLIMYLENHISALKNNPGNQFHVFVTYDFSFQIQALAGEVRSESEGEFTIQCMVNIGQPEEEGFLEES